MPRLSRPTLKPNASSAWVTAFSSARLWASAGTGKRAAANRAADAGDKRTMAARLIAGLPLRNRFGAKGRAHSLQGRSGEPNRSGGEVELHEHQPIAELRGHVIIWLGVAKAELAVQGLRLDLFRAGV